MTHEPPSGWGASTHPGLERLAELEEGLLDSADANRVAEHAADCAHCQAQQAQLNRTRSLLGSLPADEIPAAVAARLDTALADADSPRAKTVVPLGAGLRRWRQHPTAAGLGAAAAAAALVAALVVGHNSGKSTGGGPEAASGGGAGSPTGTVLNDLASTTSGTDYTTGNLASKVPALVAGPAVAGAQVAPGAAQPKAGAGTRNTPFTTKATGVPAELARLQTPAALRSCVLGVEAGGAIQRPLAIDFARYQGAAAVLIVLPGLNAGYLDAWFVGPACSESDANLLGYKAIPSSASPSPGG